MGVSALSVCRTLGSDELGGRGADYEGAVQVWDASTSLRVLRFDVRRCGLALLVPSVTERKSACGQEHEKRVWSVDTCPNDPRLLISGSDDLKGKWGEGERGKGLPGQTERSSSVCAGARGETALQPSNGALVGFGN